MNRIKNLQFTHFFIVLILLVVEVALERQLRPACFAFEATGMVESEILQRADSVDLINNFFASQARRLVEVGSIHDSSTVSFTNRLSIVLSVCFALSHSRNCSLCRLTSELIPRKEKTLLKRRKLNKKSADEWLDHNNDTEHAQLAK